jgi:hypothetical protein
MIPTVMIMGLLWRFTREFTPATNVFHCFDASCGRKGDVIDLWASVNGMSLRQAAMDLVRTFHLETAPE